MTLLPDDVLGVVGVLLDFTLESVRRRIIITKLWISVAQVTVCGLTFTLHVVAIIMLKWQESCVVHLHSIYCHFGFSDHMWVATPQVEITPQVKRFCTMVDSCSLWVWKVWRWKLQMLRQNTQIYCGVGYVLSKHNWGHNHTIYYYRMFSNMLISAL